MQQPQSHKEPFMTGYILTFFSAAYCGYADLYRLLEYLLYDSVLCWNNLQYAEYILLWPVAKYFFKLYLGKNVLLILISTSEVKRYMLMGSWLVGVLPKVLYPFFIFYLLLVSSLIYRPIMGQENIIAVIPSLCFFF